MHQSIFTFLFISAAIAGTSVLWRNWLAQHPGWEAFIKKTLGSLSPMLLCGSCFTYWLSLAGAIAFPAARELAGSVSSGVLTYPLAWMALGYISVLLRFGYVLIQEKVSMLVHQHDHAHGASR